MTNAVSERRREKDMPLAVSWKPRVTVQTLFQQEGYSIFRDRCRQLGRPVCRLWWGGRKVQVASRKLRTRVFGEMACRRREWNTTTC